MSNEGIAVQISEQEVTKEAVLEFMRGALAPVDVRDGLNRIAEFVEESVGNVKSSLAEAKRKPKEALLATIGVMAIAAGMASTRLGGATQAELAIELNRSFDNALVEQAIPIPFPGEFPAAPTLPRTVPRTIPGEQDIPYTGGRADSLPYADAVPIDRVDILPYADAIPFERDVSAQPPAPDRLVDYVVPAALPEPGTPEIKRMLRHEGEKLRFTVYNIQPGDTLSDITFREVFHGNVSPYQTGANNETHFSDEFIQAARDIAIENLAIGSMQPPALTPEGDIIGLTETYNDNNENMTQEQQVHAFVEQLSITVQNNPGDRDALRELFDNGIAPELIPHVLRYLKADDNIYLPVYSRTQQEEKAQSHEKPQSARANSAYFNEFGARKNRRF